MKEFNKEKFHFYLKYCLIPEKIQDFKNKLAAIRTAVKINPELAKEAKKQLIEEYPFTQEFMD